MQATATQKVNEVITQLNAALLQKDLLSEQLEQTGERVKALRNLLAGIDLGKQVAKEEQAVQDDGNFAPSPQ